jgi:hypothetical protein
MYDPLAHADIRLDSDMIILTKWVGQIIFN